VSCRQCENCLKPTAHRVLFVLTNLNLGDQIRWSKNALKEYVNIDTSILILKDNDDEPAESDFVKINLKEDEIIETPKKLVTVEEGTDKELDSKAVKVPTSSDKTVNLEKEENYENALHR